MINEELKKYIDEKVEEFRKSLTSEIEQKSKKPKTIWDLKGDEREPYYIIGEDGELNRETFDSDFDEKVRDMGNAFLTKEGAEFEIESRKIETILKRYSRPFKCGGENWFIDYDVSDEMFKTRYVKYNSSGIPYFETEEIAIQVIHEIGRDKLIEYWFKVEEQNE